ncbi:MAG TPA: PAS domain S-box protein, partial [Kiritimatiellia bacterium]
MPLPFPDRPEDEQFTQVADQAPVMLWVSGADGKCTYLSRHWLEFTGIPLERQLGDGWLDSMHPDDRARCAAAFDRALRQREKLTIEFRLRRRDGEYRWIVDTGVPQVDASGRFKGFMGSCIDITDRKHSEEQLLQSARDISLLKEAEARQLATTQDLRGIVEIAYELIVCPDLDAMLRRAVELAREKLRLERASIFICERGYVRGTYGTDMDGRTTDEHMYYFPLDDVWQDRFRARSRKDSRWNLVEDDWCHWDGRAMSVRGRGWIAISPIVISTGQTIAVFCNDCAVSGSPFDERKQEVVMVFCSLLGSIIERRRWEEGLRLQDRLLDAVAKASNLLLVSGDREDAIRHALSLVGEATNVDRVCVFENHRHPQTGVFLCSQRYEWARDGVTPQIENPVLQAFAYAGGLMRLYNLLAAGKAYSGLVCELPPEERRIFQAQDIRSILIVPIFVKEKFWGFIGLDDCHSDRLWSTNEESILFAMAGNVGTVMARRHAEALLVARDKLLQGVAHATRQILTATHFE